MFWWVAFVRHLHLCVICICASFAFVRHLHLCVICICAFIPVLNRGPQTRFRTHGGNCKGATCAGWRCGQCI